MTIERNTLYSSSQRKRFCFYSYYILLMHTIQRAQERGSTRISWLKSFHSFSFGEYYDPSKMGFGPLRVLNDDNILGGTGFHPHQHSNMEIISIPLK